MPLLLDESRSALRPAGGAGGARWKHRSRPATAGVIDIGLINNMPDAALEQTESQFRTLLDAAAGSAPVRVHLFSLPSVPRGERAQEHLRTHYVGFDEIWDFGLDALIVTGTEPRAADLRDEPYWERLSELFDWAECDGVPTMLSCLAAHAAALHGDGIARRRLPEKRFGVFAHDMVAAHPLTRDVAAPFAIPHSRWNELPEAALTECGWRVLTRSAEAGVDLFIRQRRSLFVGFQGHPEYDAATLLREYKRDVRRYLAGSGEHYPGLPCGYFDSAATHELAMFRARATAQRHEALMAEFPVKATAVPRRAPWQETAATIWRNWLGYIRERDG